MELETQTKEKVKSFHSQLKEKMDSFVHGIYKATRSFPKEELYGVISQIRRAALSVILNYIEGYARGREKVHKNFLEISYGSLQEAKYLLEFSVKEKFISEEDFKNLLNLADDIGAMLWGILRKF